MYCAMIHHDMYKLRYDVFCSGGYKSRSPNKAMIRRQLADMAATKGRRKGGRREAGGGWGWTNNKNVTIRLRRGGETSASIVRETLICQERHTTCYDGEIA